MQTFTKQKLNYEEIARASKAKFTSHFASTLPALRALQRTMATCLRLASKKSIVLLLSPRQGVSRPPTHYVVRVV